MRWNLRLGSAISRSVHGMGADRMTRLRVDEVHSSGHFIDEFILAALVRRLEKHPFESHFFTKCEQQPGPIHLVA